MARIYPSPTASSIFTLDETFGSGRYYGNVFAVGGTGTLAIPGLSQCYLIPFIVSEPVSFDRIAIHVSTANASAVLRLGIYTSNADGRPTAVMHEAGTVDASTTGLKTITVDYDLSAGEVYWLACQPEGATCTVHSSATHVNNFMGKASSTESHPGGGQVLNGSGALPTSLAGITYNNNNPAILLRAV